MWDASGGSSGTGVVQVHITNSRLTDPQVLEFRFPVRLDNDAIRTGSGGAGRSHGCHGGVWRVRFLEAMTAAIFSNVRVVPSGALTGCAPGALCLNHVERADGGIETSLARIGSTAMEPGDERVTLETAVDRLPPLVTPDEH